MNILHALDSVRKKYIVKYKNERPTHVIRGRPLPAGYLIRQAHDVIEILFVYGFRVGISFKKVQVDGGGIHA